MSTVPEAPSGPPGASVSKTAQSLRSCWGCRMVSGGGLFLAGAYVYQGARKVMRQGGPTSMGTVAQITFAACLAAWGIEILVDPVGKAERKA